MDADLLVTAASVVTVDATDTIFSPGAIAVSGDRIVAVGPADQLVSKVMAARKIERPRCHVFPGLINTHNHLWQTMLKGLGDDMPLIEWIDALLVPTMPLLDEEVCYLGAVLGALESARSGCTTQLDFMHHIPCTPAFDEVFRAFDEIGGTVILGRALRDRLPAGRPPIPGDLTLGEQLDHVQRLMADHGADRVWLAPSTVWGMTEEGLRTVRAVASDLGVPITIHMNEVAFDSEETVRRFGMRSLPYLDSIGFLGPDVLHAHCVFTDADDIRILADRGCAVSYNPVSNMYLGSGVPPILALRDAGVRLSLATDGAASNNSQDMLEAIKLGALLQKVVHRDPTALTAAEVLRMASAGGADALARPDLGSLEVGKRADFFLFDPFHPKSTPLHDPVSTLVYSGGEANVTTTVCGGQVILDDGRITRADEQALLLRAQDVAVHLAERAGTARLVRRRGR